MWLSGKGYAVPPWIQEDLHALEQLSHPDTTIEPVLQSLGAPTIGAHMLQLLKLVGSRACALQQ